MTASDELPLDLLLAQRGYVHALASELVFDAHAARDVEQEVLLAALAHAPRKRGALRGWLAALVRNVARKTWRSSARRNRREAASARPEAGVPSPAEILEREELRRRLVEAVLALDEPLRAVLVLRFLEELPPREVARRLGLPVETVRTRVQRGVELLRVRLDRESRGDRSAWCLAFVRELRLPLAPAWLVSSSLAGVIVMSLAKKAAVGAGLLGLAAAGWFVSQRGARTPSGASPTAAAQTTVELVGADDLSVEVADVPDPIGMRTTADATADATAVETATPLDGSLLLRVTWHDGAPAEDVAATLHPSDAEDFYADLFVVRTAGDGTCLIEDLAPGRVTVVLDRGSVHRAEVRAAEVVELAIGIPRGFDVEGIVVEQGEIPVPDAEIFSDPMGGGDHEHRVARSDHEGRFFVRSLEDGLCWLSARAAGRTPSPRYVLMSGNGATLEAHLTIPDTGGALKGTISDGSGQALVGAQILVGEFSFGRVEVPEKIQAHPPTPAKATADERGRFELPGLPTGAQMVRVRARDFAPWTGEVVIEAERTTQLAVILSPETSVEGTVSDASGKRLAGIEIASDGDFLARVTRSRADGTFFLRGLPAGEFELTAEGETLGRARATLHGSPGATLRWDAVLDGGLSIRGRVVAPGLDPTQLDVRCERILASGEYTLLYARPDASGVFTIGGLADAEYELSIEPRVASGVYRFPLVSLRAVRPGPDDVEVSIDPRAWPSIRLVGRVVDAHGAGLAGVPLTASLERHTNGPLLTTDEDGGFDLGPYPPGRWTLVVRPPGKPELRLGPLDLAPDEVHDFGDLVVE